MSAPPFSIIIPTFNAVDTAAKTIDSVLAQAEGLAEMIVVDGGSTDGTVDVLKSYGERVRWVSQPDRGLYDAMNKGIDLSRGRFLNFQGAGDLLRPGILARVAEALPTETPAFVYGKVRIVDEDRVEGEPFSKMTLRNGNIPHQAVFYSRDVFDVVGRYDLQYPVLADYALCLKCFGDERVRKVFVDEVVSDYLGGGVSTQRHDEAFYRDWPRLIRENLGADVYWAWRLQKLIPMSWRRARAAGRLG